MAELWNLQFCKLGFSLNGVFHLLIHHCIFSYTNLQACLHMVVNRNLSLMFLLIVQTYKEDGRYHN